MRLFFMRTIVGVPADVVEAQLVERVGDRQRPAEAHAPVHVKVVAPLERDANHLQEVLIPPDRDAVLRHAAESGENAVVQLVP
jgi:hypothetical protein